MGDNCDSNSIYVSGKPFGEHVDAITKSQTNHEESYAHQEAERAHRDLESVSPMPRDLRDSYRKV